MYDLESLLFKSLPGTDYFLNNQTLTLIRVWSYGGRLYIAAGATDGRAYIIQYTQRADESHPVHLRRNGQQDILRRRICRRGGRQAVQNFSE
jgi:hypothetical protein